MTSRLERIAKIEMVDEAMAEILRQKTPAERLAMVNSMWVFVRDLVRLRVIQEHPDWSEEEIQRQVARRMSHGAV